MKIVVFAHVPPPFHGQSYMVELMVRGLGGDRRSGSHGARSATTARAENIECYHVDARFSDEMSRAGLFQLRKLFRLFGFCWEAIWCRFRHGADVFYYVPAPPRRVPFLRDCIVLMVCRPFFRETIFHWHANGLSEWLEGPALSIERSLGRFLLSRPDLSLILAESRSADAVYFESRRVCVVPNGIPDPCPEFESILQPARRERIARNCELLERKAEPDAAASKYRVLFLAHLTREKGLFDALAAVSLANQQLETERSSLRLHLTIAGSFQTEPEQEEFERWVGAHADEVRLLGFVEGEAKAALLQECDCLCFPTYYAAEAQPVAIIEAMACGLNVVASRWRGIPEMLPPDYPLLVPVRDPAAIASALIQSACSDRASMLSSRYLEEFTAAKYLERLAEALTNSAVPVGT